MDLVGIEPTTSSMPCHFQGRMKTGRYTEIRSDTERQCSCGFHACSLPFVCDRATRRETARHGQGWQGYDTNHDTKRHRAVDDTGRWTPYGSIQPDRQAPRAPAWEGGSIPARVSDTTDIRKVNICKLIPEQRRRAVEGVGILGLTAPHQILHFNFQRNCDPLQHP